jgi:hypothetical protein
MRAGAPIAGLAGKAFLPPGLDGRSAELDCDAEPEREVGLGAPGG